MTSYALTPLTPEQDARVEWLRGRIDSAVGTDATHWVLAKVLVVHGILDEVIADARREAIAPLVDATEFQTEALSEVLARSVWESYSRAPDWGDLGSVTVEVQRGTARRYLDALREFLSR